jgi:hypothetical protein
MLDAGDPLRSKDCKCQKAIPCICGGRNGKFPYKFGDHELWVKEADNPGDLIYGLYLYCTRCGASITGTMTVTEIKQGRISTVLIERTYSIFVNKIPRLCDESIIEQIHDS